MPHPEDPTQISLEYSIVNIGGVDNLTHIGDEEEFVDPRGEYVSTPSFVSEWDSTDAAHTVYSIENQGVDLRIAGVFARASQGAEDGRVSLKFGWSLNQGATVPVQSLAYDYGVPVGPSSGRHRTGVQFWFPDDIRPLFEFKDTFYISLQGDSSTADNVKGAAWAHFVPDHRADIS